MRGNHHDRIGDFVSDAGGLAGPCFQRLLDAFEPERGGTVTDFRPISGGYSRLSALGTVRWADGAEETFVLRSDPPPDTGVFDSDRDTEWRLLESMSGTSDMLTPTPRWYDATGEYFGAKCLIVDFFRGRALAELAKEPEGRDRAQDIFVDTLAGIHGTPLHLLPAETERPADWDSYLDGLVEHLRRIDRDVADSSPPLHYTAAQLAAHRPPPVPLTFVHGDAQPVNLLVPERGDPLVIDWEFARIGDPREDLGYYSRLPVPPNLYEHDPERFLARYRERTGLSEEQINRDTLDYFYVLGTARLLGQMIHSADSVANGTPRGAMALYLLNGISGVMARFVEVARRLAS